MPIKKENLDVVDMHEINSSILIIQTPGVTTI